jgi:predicted flap endonuclease-1-like 5' DNA nuclease
LFSQLFSLVVAQAGQSGRLAPWLILLMFLVIVVIVAWAMLRNTEGDAEGIEAHEPVEEDAHAEPEPKPALGESAPAGPDDLKKIEGIGPKVAGLLNENGITTFAQLAETNLEQLNEMLDAAGLQIMDPQSWPIQAKLAALGDWPALEKLQDELKGGRAAE